MASSAPTLSANFLASFTRPASGDTTTRSSRLQVAEVLGEDEHRRHVVHRLLEEALHLAGVEVHGEHAVGARGLEHVGHEAGADRLARGRLLVLARVAVPRRHGDHAVGRRADRRVDHHHQLHQRVVRDDARLRVAAHGLDDEHVGAADGLLVAAVDLAVGERLERHAAEVDAQLARDPGGQRGVGAAREQHEPLAVLEVDRGGATGCGPSALTLPGSVGAAADDDAPGGRRRRLRQRMSAPRRSSTRSA